MSDQAILIGIITASLVAAGMLAGLVDRASFDIRWLFIAGTLFVVNEVSLTRGLWLISPISGLDDNWNWSGKFAALTASLALASLPIFGWRACGMRLSQEGWRVALLVTLVFALIYIGLGWLMGEGGGNGEAILYQSTMPGFEEEIFYRGLFLLALDRAFLTRVEVFGARIGWSLPLNAMVFGLVHGLSINEQTIGFDWLAFTFPFLGSVPAIWLRERTGSVALPIVLHNLGNVAFLVLPI